MVDVAVDSGHGPPPAGGAAVKARPARWLSYLVWAIGGPLALTASAMVLAALATGDTSPTTIMAPLAGVTSVIVGAVLVTRLPRHRIGWLLWVGGLLIVITRITQGVADHGLTTDPGSVPGAIWFGWVNAWVGLPAVVMLPIFLPLVYPTGRLLSPRWRIVAVAATLGVVAGTLLAAVGPFPTGTYPPDVVNPLEIRGAAHDILAVIGDIQSLLLFFVLVLGLGSLLIRYRRSAGIERQQLKGFVFVGSIAVVAFISAALDLGNTVGPLATIDNLAWLTAFAGLALLPVAIGIAVLRYHLYEIDRLISRTIGYGVLSAILATLFALGVLGVQAVLGPLTGSNTLAVAGSTLFVASLFQPIRRRVQRTVDRRFNRARYDAERTVAALQGRLRDDVDLQELRGEITRTVGQSVEPGQVSLWLRK